MASPLRRWLIGLLASVSVAAGGAFAASWAVWWFWYDVPPPQVVVPRCPSDADLYIQVVAVKGYLAEYHCFHIGDATDVIAAEQEARRQALMATPDPSTDPTPDYSSGSAP